MSERVTRCRHAVVLALLLVLAGCSAPSFVKQFEYEEDITLALDGSATVVVNASVPALVALRGLPLKPDPAARLDRALVRRLYEAPGVNVTRVSRPWRRRGRRFVQIRLEVADVRMLAAAGPFAWSAYRMQPSENVMTYRQVLGPPAGKPVNGVSWTGAELIGFRLHLPSRIVYHNAPSRSVERGNILSWEQLLSDRLSGQPLEIEVRMEQQSILYRTLTVFGAAAAAALFLLAAAVYWVWRRGRAHLRAPGSRDAA